MDDTKISRRRFLQGGALSSGVVLSGPLLLSSSTAVASSIQPVVTAPFDVSLVRDTIDKAISNFAAPGISLAVWYKGSEVYAQHVGYANLEMQSLVKKDSIFRIGSLSKQFSAALLLKLAEVGALKLDDPAKKYLPFFKGKATFRIRELLHQTAGIHDEDVDTRQLKDRSQFELAKLIVKQKQLFDFTPGSAWLYSNSNYLLAGAIIEQVSGKSMAQAAKEYLFEPLKLSKTSFDDPSAILPGRVSGYTPTESTATPFQNAAYEDIVINGAAGGMISTASDLCRWHHALFSGAALSPASLEQMTAPGMLRNKRKASTNRFSANDKHMGNVDYGLGLMLDHDSTSDQALIVTHHGGVSGFASQLVSHPSSGLSYACLCNSDSNPKLPFREMRRAVLASVLQK